LFLRDTARNRLVAETLEQRCDQELEAIQELENCLATGKSITLPISSCDN